jgi:hypothetical protein
MKARPDHHSGHRPMGRPRPDRSPAVRRLQALGHRHQGRRTRLPARIPPEPLRDREHHAPRVRTRGGRGGCSVDKESEHTDSSRCRGGRRELQLCHQEQVDDAGRIIWVIDDNGPTSRGDREEVRMRNRKMSPIGHSDRKWSERRGTNRRAELFGRHGKGLVVGGCPAQRDYTTEPTRPRRRTLVLTRSTPPVGRVERGPESAAPKRSAR